LIVSLCCSSISLSRIDQGLTRPYARRHRLLSDRDLEKMGDGRDEGIERVRGPEEMGVTSLGVDRRKVPTWG
jgi:hypothetical protein